MRSKVLKFFLKVFLKIYPHSLTKIQNKNWVSIYASFAFFGFWIRVYVDINEGLLSSFRLVKISKVHLIKYSLNQDVKKLKKIIVFFLKL